MTHDVVASPEAKEDLKSIHAFLVRSYIGFGEPRREARRRAMERLRSIRIIMQSLGRTPHRGTDLAPILRGLRMTTIERVIFYFAVDEDVQRVRILAVFFGGQDHRRHFLRRLRSD